MVPLAPPASPRAHCCFGIVNALKRHHGANPVHRRLWHGPSVRSPSTAPTTAPLGRSRLDRLARISEECGVHLQLVSSFFYDRSRKMSWTPMRLPRAPPRDDRAALERDAQRLISATPHLAESQRQERAQRATQRPQRDRGLGVRANARRMLLLDALMQIHGDLGGRGIDLRVDEPPAPQADGRMAWAELGAMGFIIDMDAQLMAFEQIWGERQQLGGVRQNVHDRAVGASSRAVVRQSAGDSQYHSKRGGGRVTAAA